MSWDLHIDEEYVCGPTHNLNHMMRSASVYPREVPRVPVAGEVLFREPVLGVDWSHFNGRPAREVAVFADDLRRELERDPAHCDMVIKAAGWWPDGIWQAHG